MTSQLKVPVGLNRMAKVPPSVQDVVRKLVDYHIVRPEPHVHVYADDPYCLTCGVLAVESRQIHTIKIRSSPKDFDVCIGEIDIHGATGYWGYGNINEAVCTANRLREIGCVIETSWDDRQ